MTCPVAKFAVLPTPHIVAELHILHLEIIGKIKLYSYLIHIHFKIRSTYRDQGFLADTHKQIVRFYHALQYADADKLKFLLAWQDATPALAIWLFNVMYFHHRVAFILP